jgi:hypothetical protein
MSNKSSIATTTNGTKEIYEKAKFMSKIVHLTK